MFSMVSWREKLNAVERSRLEGADVEPMWRGRLYNYSARGVK
jgi:hypothetical protein